jgi:eukaryotic-like serine/threonine-protein kinase
VTHDRAHRPDISGSHSALPPSSSDAGAPPLTSTSVPDIRAGGTYFLGRYRVVDEIGIGGMASVHLARMDGPGGFQKWVAIKKIHPHLVEDESFVQMFLDEARVAARISHPNVATVFDLGKHDDTYWIAMEYLHGEPLREVMRRTEELGTAMPPEIACRVIADAAEGLHAAHELLGKNGEKLGLVHRDVTPHNLFVTYDGVTKVVDFGIAKFSSRMSHTRAGTLKGKLAYMSPEQVHGEGIDRRTDIFALGVVLWELTTGQRLFRMESDLDTLAKVQECNVPRPSTLIRGYPVDLEKIVMKALAKNRGERFRTARELSRALQSLLMRRGLFIASDEVAAYTQSIFSERIQKREAHLRWAAEVTQTINVDQLLSKPKIDREYTNSEVQAAGPGAKPMPAAGAPPPPRPAAGMPIGPMGQMPPPGRIDHQMLPADAKETAPSFTMQRAPDRGTAPPRPAAGMPPGDHPADGDGPTIESSQLQDQYGLIDPPTLLDHSAVDRPRARASAPQVIEPEDFEEEDQDETIVGARDQPTGSNTPFAFPTPGVRSAPVPPPVASTARPHQRFAATAALPSTSPLAPPPSPFGPSYGSKETPFGPDGLPLSAPVASVPHDYGSDHDMYERAQRSMAEPYPRQPHPSGGEYMPRPISARMQPTMPRMAHDNRTMTAQRFRRRPPMWVVAALSCSMALLIAGVVIAIISTTAPPQARSSPVPTGATAGAVGPFTAARTAFTAVVTAPPPPAPQPAPQPGPLPTTGAVTAPVETSAPAATVATAIPASTATAIPSPPASPQRTAAPAAVPQAPQPSTKKAAAGTGTLTVVCLPRCDQIIDNGASLGPGHIFNLPVPAGRHILVLSAPNGVKKTVPVDVTNDKQTEVRMSMDKP